MAEEKRRPGRPVQYEVPRKRLTIELPVKVVEHVDEMAEDEGVSRTQFIEMELELAWHHRKRA